MEGSIEKALTRLDTIITKCGVPDDKINVYLPISRELATREPVVPNHKIKYDIDTDAVIASTTCARCGTPMADYTVSKFERKYYLSFFSGAELSYCPKCGQCQDYNALKKKSWTKEYESAMEYADELLL